jgi:SAM-dependent methyltransferase
MRSFAHRSREPEWMDDGSVDYETFHGCLRDLAQVNVVTLAHRPTLAWLDSLRRQGRFVLGRPVEIVDAGAGYGDLLREIQRWAARRGVDVRLTGVDLNPWSARAAAGASDGSIHWVTRDVLAFEQPCDIVVSSLFTHHLSDNQNVAFLQWMERRAQIGWFINDLHRHPFPFYGFALLARAMRWHPFVGHDGPISIARAFTARDWRALLARAEVEGARVAWRFPFRLCVSKVRP